MSDIAFSFQLLLSGPLFLGSLSFVSLFLVFSKNNYHAYAEQFANVVGKSTLL